MPTPAMAVMKLRASAAGTFQPDALLWPAISKLMAGTERLATAAASAPPKSLLAINV
jgi:hypothetical protein